MSETTLAAFDDYLNHVLASLPVREGRRRDMREELLAHLMAIFDEEIVRCGDEPKAVAQTLRRFGAVHPLESELGAAVPFTERGLTWLYQRKEKIMWRLFLVLGVVAVLVGMAFVMPALQEFLFHEVGTLSVVLFTLGLSVCLAGVWSFVVGIQRFRVRNL